MSEGIGGMWVVWVRISACAKIFIVYDNVFEIGVFGNQETLVD
jgi:hypothetical protein